MKPFWWVILAVSLALIGAAVTVAVLYRPRRADVGGRVAVAPAELDDRAVVEDEWRDASQVDPLAHEAVGVVPASAAPELPGQAAAAEPAAPPAKRRHVVAYRRRDPTVWVAPVHRVRMGYYGLQLADSGVPLLQYGVAPGAETADPPYVYDSVATDQVLVPTVLRQQYDEPGPLQRPALLASATFVEIEVEVRRRKFTLRLCLGCGGGARFGDVQLRDEQTGRWEWWDERLGLVAGERPAGAANLFGHEVSDQEEDGDDTPVRGVPLELLSAPSAPFGDDQWLDLLAVTAAAFRREPPAQFDSDWVVRNVCGRSFTRAVSAILS